MTDFVWNDGEQEMELREPEHPTYVPLCGNRFWALLPTSLDGYCYGVNLPNFLRVVKRLGLCVRVGRRGAWRLEDLESLRTFYGAGYLRLTGRRDGVDIMVLAFPDAEESVLYLVVVCTNTSGSPRSVEVLLAVDFEVHQAHWNCKGFTEDATGDYSGIGRKVNTPHDDWIRVADGGEALFVQDARNPGVGFAAVGTPTGWTLDRAGFSFETPLHGYHRGHLAIDTDTLALGDELAHVQHDVQ